MLITHRTKKTVLGQTEQLYFYSLYCPCTQAYAHTHKIQCKKVFQGHQPSFMSKTCTLNKRKCSCFHVKVLLESPMSTAHVSLLGNTSCVKLLDYRLFERKLGSNLTANHLRSSLVFTV